MWIEPNNKRGKARGKQRYGCLNCKANFVPKDTDWLKKAYFDCSKGKQTYAELEVKYKKSARTLRKHFDSLEHSPFPSPIECIPEINLIFDTTFFGRNFGVMVFRAPGINLFWKYVKTEIVLGYRRALDENSHKFRILSFTIDGRPGVRKMLETYFPEVPVQFCKFHQVAIIQRYTTKRPKTECEKGLLKLGRLLKSLSENEFRDKLKSFENKFKAFLSEKK